MYCRFDDKLALICFNSRSIRRARHKALSGTGSDPFILRTGHLAVWLSFPVKYLPSSWLTRMLLKWCGCDKWYQTSKGTSLLCLCFKITCLHWKKSVAFSQSSCNECFNYSSVCSSIQSCVPGIFHSEMLQSMCR